MQERYKKQYVNGQWTHSFSSEKIRVRNPATDEDIGAISAGCIEDVDNAVQAARTAFPIYSRTSKAIRLALLKKIATVYERRLSEMGTIISTELGAPLWLAHQYQAPLGLGHLDVMHTALTDLEENVKNSGYDLIFEGIGVCALITPWNWPQHQIMSKVAAAIAAGCTIVLKPSQHAPFNACLLADIMEEAGLPDGVFNLVNGHGKIIGNALAEHPNVDMISFTGSESVGIGLAQKAAPTVKRVIQELGGKSPNIILPKANLKKAVAEGVMTCFANSGQNCIAPSRMLIQKDQYDEAIEVARTAAESIIVGAPADELTYMGPIATESQYHTVQSFIQKGVSEGAEIITGGAGNAFSEGEGLYAKPTIFAQVEPHMEIATEEIFGPVLCLIPYETIEHAIEIANDTRFGLAAYVSGPDEEARQVATQLSAGNVYLNGAQMDIQVPFGGYKRSGNGREFGHWGLEEFMETKAVIRAA